MFQGYIYVCVYVVLVVVDLGKRGVCSKFCILLTIFIRLQLLNKVQNNTWLLSKISCCILIYSICTLLIPPFCLENEIRVHIGRPREFSEQSFAEDLRQWDIVTLTPGNSNTRVTVINLVVLDEVVS